MNIDPDSLDNPDRTGLQPESSLRQVEVRGVRAHPASSRIPRYLG